jgi:hypothetical protein
LHRPLQGDRFLCRSRDTRKFFSIQFSKNVSRRASRDRTQMRRIAGTFVPSRLNSAGETRRFSLQPYDRDDR